MAADLAELKAMIEAALPGRRGRGDRRRPAPATTCGRPSRAPQFEGLTRIDQHRLVKAAVKERFDDGTIHALVDRSTDAPAASSSGAG